MNPVKWAITWSSFNPRTFNANIILPEWTTYNNFHESHSTRQIFILLEQNRVKWNVRGTKITFENLGNCSTNFHWNCQLTSFSCVTTKPACLTDTTRWNNTLTFPHARIFYWVPRAGKTRASSKRSRLKVHPRFRPIYAISIIHGKCVTEMNEWNVEVHFHVISTSDFYWRCAERHDSVVAIETRTLSWKNDHDRQFKLIIFNSFIERFSSDTSKPLLSR